MTLRDIIKIILIESGISLSDLVRMLNEKYNREDTIQNITNKITRESLKYSELDEITELLGYEVRLIKKNTPLN